MAHACAPPPSGLRRARYHVRRPGRLGPGRAVVATGLSLLATLLSCPLADAAFTTSGTLVAQNCAPVAATSGGTMVWYGRNRAGLWDAYIGRPDCQGQPLLPEYPGNRGPADMTADGRYVLLTTAVGWDRTAPWSAPGRGSQNAIQLYDRQTGRLSTLLAGGTSSQRGVIWPKLSPDGTKIAWSQMVNTGSEVPPGGRWALHVADVNLEQGTLSNNVEWQDPNGEPAFYEAYGWVPGTHLLIFMSTTRATSTGWGVAQLFTLPDDLGASTAPTRISPRYPSAWSWQPPFDAYHEFAAFAPGDPDTLYTSIGADTVGGDDLFAYGLHTQEPGGLLALPKRVSYFGGDVYFNGGAQAIPGWPKPTYTVVTTMAWVNGGWVATTCPDLLCEQVSAWRISLDSGAAVTPPPTAPGVTPEETPPPSPSQPSPPRRPPSTGRGGHTHTGQGGHTRTGRGGHTRAKSRPCRVSGAATAGKGRRAASRPARHCRRPSRAGARPRSRSRAGLLRGAR